MQAFSPALDSLLALRSQVAERTKKMESDVRRANREYGKRLRELDSGFDAVGGSFSHLENKMSDVGRTATRVGEQLESLHQTRSTAQAVALLLSYYLSLVHQTGTTSMDDTASPLEQLYATKNTREGRVRLALVLRRLMAVAKDVADSAAVALSDAEAAAAKDGHMSAAESGNTPAHKAVLHRRAEKEKADRVSSEIEKYCEKFEREVLKYFDRAYRKGDPRMMAHCATVLQDFNGGMSCVQVYVNQHDFFISKESLLDEVGDGGDIWRTIGDPDTPPPTTEPGLTALFKSIRHTVSQEAQIVKAVFPDPSAVLQVFLQRVFAQVIQQHIEMLVNRASSISTLAFLRTLSLTHSMCASLVEDLKGYEGSLGVGVAGPSKPADTVTGPLAALLDQALEEIYVPWLEGTRYLDSESKNLVELYGGLLSRFTRYHEMVLKAKPNSLLDRVVGQVPTVQATAAISKYANLFTNTITSSATSAFSSDKGPKAPEKPVRSISRLSVQGLTPRPSLSRHDSLRASGNGAESPTERLDPVDGQLAVPMAERMLRWHAEAIGRVVELSPSAEVPKNVMVLSKVLSEAFGRSFTETALESGVAKLEQGDPRSEPDLSVLAVLKNANLVCQLWQRYSSTALVPLTGSAAVVRREMTTFNQHNVVLLEGKINALIQKAIDVIVAWLAQLLLKQKKHDYRPKNDELSFARTNTEPCELICDFLASLRDAASALSGKNREAFLLEVGVAFHSLLLDHYKKFAVNPTGGLMLTKDLASYQEAVGLYAIPALNDRFDMLRQLGNSFIVQPEVLRSYMTESHLGRIDARLLRPYLQQRSDWSQFYSRLAFDDLGPADDSPAPSGTATPLAGGVSTSARRAGHRLSAMSGVAGAGMAAGYARLREALREFENLTDAGEKDKKPVTAGGAGAAPAAPPSAFMSRNNSGASVASAPTRRNYVPGFQPLH